MENPGEKKSVLPIISAIMLFVMLVSLLGAFVLIIVQTASAKKIFIELGISLPLPTIFFLKVAEVLQGYWYLWGFLFLLLASTSILTEVFLKGKIKILNIIVYSIFTVISWLLILLCRLAINLPLQQIIRKTGEGQSV